MIQVLTLAKKQMNGCTTDLWRETGKDLKMSITEITHKMTYKEQECYDLGFAKGYQKAKSEVKHGHWEWNNDAIDWNIGAYVCNLCHSRNDNIHNMPKISPNNWAGSNYCPNCGARMDGEE